MQPAPGVPQYTFQYTTSAVPPQATWYRFSFAGDANYAAALSPAVKVTPRVSLTRPVAASGVNAGTRFAAYGYLKPRHKAGAVYVTIRCYRKASSGGAGVLKKLVPAPGVNYRTYTKYQARFSLTVGSWKLVARYAATAKYAQTTSSALYLRAN